jgi:DnaA initiator-associating protein
MNYYQTIAGNFHATMEAISLSVDEIAEPLHQASEKIVASLLQDAKVMVGGTGPQAALVQLFVSGMMEAGERERPALPAMSLAMDDGRQLMALGQADDILLLIGDDNETCAATLVAARERQMSIVILCGRASVPTAADPNSDTIIALPALPQARTLELQTMCLCSLLELIENTLFGEIEKEL